MSKCTKFNTALPWVLSNTPPEVDWMYDRDNLLYGQMLKLQSCFQ